MKPRLLDLFCGAGLAADGYIAAGYEVTGVDNVDQPAYPGRFVKADAMAVLALLGTGLLTEFDLIHASPPCQLFTRAGRLRDAQGGESRFGDLLTPTIAALAPLDVAWVVENVEGAKGIMPGAVRLCGSAFGLAVQRHRLFLSNRPLTGVACDHASFPADPITGKPRPWGVYHIPGDLIPSGGRTARNATHAAEVMGVERELPWASLKDGFPPAYSAWLGRQLVTPRRS